MAASVAGDSAVGVGLDLLSLVSGALVLTCIVPILWDAGVCVSVCMCVCARARVYAQIADDDDSTSPRAAAGDAGGGGALAPSPAHTHCSHSYRLSVLIAPHLAARYASDRGERQAYSRPSGRREQPRL